MEPENEKIRNNVQWIIKVLLTGAELKSRDIAEIVSRKVEKELTTQQISSILSRISNSQKSNLGFFIQKRKNGNGFCYCLQKEALELSENQAYGLTLNRGAHKYDLQTALEKFPQLSQYIESTPQDIQIRDMKKSEDRMGSIFCIQQSASDSKNVEKEKIDIGIQYADKYGLSFSTSLSGFLMICAAFVLIFASCFLIAYWFFYPVFISAVIIGIFGAAALFFKPRKLPSFFKKN